MARRRDTDRVSRGTSTSPVGRGWAVLLCAVFTVAMPAVEAGAQRRGDRQGRGPWRRRIENLMPPQEVIESGYVFFNGRYEPPPYHLKITDDSVTINGKPLPWRIRWAADDDEDDPTRDHSFRRSHPLRYGVWIYRSLSEGGTLLVEPNRYGLIGHPDNLELMLAITKDTDPDTILSQDDFLHHPMRDQWRDLLTGLELTPELVARIRDEHAAWLSDVHESRQKAQRRRQRREMLDAIGQSIAPVGLASAIGAIGLLLIVKLQSRRISIPADGWDHVDTSGRRARMVLRMVLALWVLNALDLSFTMLSHEAGHLNELNPLGRMLLDDSTALMLFKGGFVALGTTVLLVLRRYRGAEVASWWLCLIYALLTLRWTTYGQVHFG
jgi:hypothetical protein